MGLGEAVNIHARPDERRDDSKAVYRQARNFRQGLCPLQTAPLIIPQSCWYCVSLMPAWWGGRGGDGPGGGGGGGVMGLGGGGGV